MSPTPKILAILVLLAACGHPVASAGPAYVWAPLSGGGTYFTYPGGVFGSFDFDGGSIEVHYDTVNPADSVLTVSAGMVEPGPPFSVTTTGPVVVGVSSGRVDFAGPAPGGAEAYAILTGDVGPLNAEGYPMSLDGLGEAAGFAQAAEHSAYQFEFSAFSVPEPPGLLMLAAGLGGMAMAGAVRRRAEGRATRGSVSSP